MLSIKNIDLLNEKLSEDNPNWQEELYERTGVFCCKKTRGYVLYSSSGWVDLDSEEEIPRDSDYIVENVNDLVEYITSMDSFHTILSDKDYGKFKKSEIFIYLLYNLIIPTTNATHKKLGIDDSEHLSLFNIEDKGAYFTINFAYTERDSSYEDIKLSESLTLLEVVDQLKNSISNCIEELKINIVLSIQENDIHVPKTFQEIKKLSDDLWF